MNKKNEICFMEARLVRLASEEFKKTIDCTVDLFEDNGVFEYINSNYEILHIESDLAVLNDIKEFLASKGVVLSD